MPDLADLLGASLDHLEFSFNPIGSVTPVQALQDHGVNQLLLALTEHPVQRFERDIRDCGLSETPGVSVLFEQEFGIDIPLFLHLRRRSADDRLLRPEHPEAEALELPL